MSDMTRRDFTKTSLAFLGSMFLLPELEAEAVESTPVFAEEHAACMPGRWVSSAKVVVGREPRVVLQFEPKIKKLPCIYDVILSHGEAHAQDHVVEWTVERQTERCSRKAAQLTGMFSDDESPDVYAWQDGVCQKKGVVMLLFDMNQRGTFRWVCAPDSEIYMKHPYKMGLVARVLQGSASVTASACVIGRNTLPEDPVCAMLERFSARTKS